MRALLAGVVLLVLGGGPPVWGAVTVSGSGAQVVLRDEDLVVRLDNGAGCHVTQVSVGDLALLRGARVLWSAELRDRQGHRAQTDSGAAAAEVAADGDTAELLWSGLRLSGDATLGVRVRLLFVPEERRIEWTIEFIGLAPGWSLYRYVFPCLSLAAEKGNDCALLEPCDWGTLTRDPLRQLNTNYWRVYPRCSLNMQVHGLQRGDRMVYLGCHDPRARTKEFVLEADAGAEALEYAVLQGTRLQYGGDYAQEYPFVLQVLAGDWYDAAQVYRRWALTAPWTWRGPLSAGTKTPRRFLETPLVLMRLGEESINPGFLADWMIRTRDWLGAPAVCHYYNWHQNFGEMTIAAYPEYFPAVPGFRQAVERMERAGIVVMPYLNARLWRTDFASWRELGQRAAVKDAYGQRHDEVYVGIPTAVMNPASRLWQWVLGELALRIVDTGCGAVYLDQLAETQPYASFDPDHPHAPGESGAWVQGYWQILERIRGEGRAIRPELVITAEGNAEPYIAGVDGFLTGNLNAPNSVPLYAAVYHDYVTCFGRYVMAEDFPLPGAMLAKFGEQFVFGAQFGWSNGFLEQVLKEDNPDALCLREMARLRASHADLLALGRMLRPLDLKGQVPTVERQWIAWDHPVTVQLPEVLNSVWQGPDGTVGVLLLNLGSQPHTLRIALPPGEYPVAAGAGQWEVTVPALSPRLLTCQGVVPATVAPPAPPVYDLLGYDRTDPAMRGTWPFAIPTDLADSASSSGFPYRYEGDELPGKARPSWLALGPGADEPERVTAVRGGVLHFDTLSAPLPGATLLRIPRGPYWQVDRQLGYTVEARLRVVATSGDPHFGFWLEAHNEQTMITLQVHPDRIEAAGNPDLAADMATALRTLRLVALPGGRGFRVYLDGEAQSPDLQGVGGLPHNSGIAFGTGASAGRVRAEVDYIRFHPGAALAP